MKNTKKFKTKTKVGLIVSGILLIAMGISVVVGVIGVLNPTAEVGEMRVTSSGETINPLTNVLKIKTKEKVGGNAPLDLKKIADTIPKIIYDGDIAVNYSRETLENFTFAMYNEDLTVLYENLNYYKHPEGKGTYIAKIQFSWGYTEDNSILTENYFKVVYN